MTWRGSSSPSDRIFSALVYVLPIVRAFPLGVAFAVNVPILGELVYLAISPFLMVYTFFESKIAFFDLIVFFGLFAGVVRNSRFSNFLRFNVMQAILIGIAVALVTIVTGVLGLSGAALLVMTLYTFTFLAAFCTCIYCIVRSATGLFPELPVLSDAAYIRIR